MIPPTAAAIIEQLGLEPHPEGGFYRETYRHKSATGGRGALTVIYYLLHRGAVSAWHRIDAVEVWHFHAGAPLELVVVEDARRMVSILGVEFDAGQAAHAVVPSGAWQSARSLGDWTLVGCTVAPAFAFAGFELAAPDWTPPE
ncbi:MAG: cupin domain-containing protein [Rhodospirillales bacterium]|nr:cupin domain-containing protein [Rhodospirillales bacterium]